MPGVSLVGVHAAGGTITGGHTVRDRIDGHPVALLGDAVAAHAPCPVVPVHCAATMAAGSSRTRIDGIPIVRAGDAASCGHAATGLASVTDDG